MEEMKEVLFREKLRLEEIIKVSRKQLASAPEGSLWLSNNQSGRQFYRYNGSKEYIPKANMELASALAQKDYDEKVLKQAEKKLSQVEKLAKLYEKNGFEQIYYDEHPERQKLIRPIELTWEQQLKEWKAKEYTGLEFREDAPFILTEKGERVRSKSEKIMADYFYRNGIEYKYECPLLLKNGRIIHPDFTFLSRKRREEVYLEHFGKMDEPAYARNAVKKLQSYEENGIFIGERLIVTYETEQTILGTRQLERLMKKYVL